MPIFDETGEFRGYHGVARNITERKRVEEALREQTERLQLGQAAMRMIIMDWNVTEDLLTWSDSPEWLRGPMPASGAIRSSRIRSTPRIATLPRHPPPCARDTGGPDDGIPLVADRRRGDLGAGAQASDRRRRW
jgi:PAS domain-containing protein